MDPITPRNRSRSVEADVYWRRRLIALAAGLGLLGLLAWAIGGATAHRTKASMMALNGSPTTPSIIIRTGTSASATATPSTSVTTRPSPRPSPSYISAPGKRPPSHPARRSRGLNGPGDDCPANDIVISLTGGDDFSATARPSFGVSVVSTDGRGCAYNVGPRYLTLTVESGGVRAWGSGDCARGGGTEVVNLTRGVPIQRTITWNRQITAPGCHTLSQAAQPGTYTVTASDAGTRSRTLVFVLH